MNGIRGSVLKELCWFWIREQRPFWGAAGAETDRPRKLCYPANHEPDRGLPASPPPDARTLPVCPALSPGRPVLPELGGEPRGDARGLPDPAALHGRRGARGARSDARRPPGGAPGRDGEEESVGAEEGAPEDGEHQHRFRRAEGVHPQRPRGHQTVEN